MGNRSTSTSAPQQIVDLVLADPVAGGKAQQRGLLVGCVVVDVHPRVAAATLAHHLQEVDQRLPLSAPVLRPRSAGTCRRSSRTPHMYSRPHVTPSSVHSGSPSKSKNRSPGSFAGSRPRARSASAISNCGTPVSRSSTCSRACVRSPATVLAAMPSTVPVDAARSATVPMSCADQRVSLCHPHAGDQQQIVVGDDVGHAELGHRKHARTDGSAQATGSPAAR